MKLIYFLPIFLAICPFNLSAKASNEFLDMDLSQLMDITITSVSKKPEQLTDAAAAVFVITQEDIQRCGATTIQDALRLAPGIHVARIGSDKWAVSSRGFNGRYSNKLLVLLDGRTLYSPAFSGVYWEMQGTLLEDIDRIEIIRGPGATLWGANAVNGVINIMTKNAGKTNDGMIRLAGGSEDKTLLGIRYGLPITGDTDARAYFTHDRKDSFSLLHDGADAQDDWDSARAGFRIDSNFEDSTSLTIQGDVYENSINQLVSPYWMPTFPYVTEFQEKLTANGWNITGRLNKKLDNDSSFSAQIYFDRAERDEAFLQQRHDTFDVDLNHQTTIGHSNRISTGLGFRLVDAGFTPSFRGTINPNQQENITYSGYIQDSITLLPDTLIFTLGTKWEKNDYTGHEWQPSGRLLWKTKENMSLWAAVSRAVKVPSQFEHGGILVGMVTPTSQRFPAVFRITGNEHYDSEEVIAYEVGYRWLPDDSLYFDAAIFYNDYDMLLESSSPGNNPLTTTLNNDIHGHSYGAEVAIEYQLRHWINFTLSYSFITLSMDSDSAYPTANKEVFEGSAPKHMASLITELKFSQRWDFNIWLRYVGELEVASITAANMGRTVDDYFDADLILNYMVTDNLKVSLIGQNLLESEKLEFISEYFTPPTEVERGVYLKATWNF